jgi:predicted nucleotide-binding protein (sugar kinase/HSP70/actin superfamily)
MLVGIPKCLSYYYLFPLYRTFLDALDIDWVESSTSNRTDLKMLNLCPTDEPCISVKLAFTHAKRLLDQGVDTLFVPKVISLSEDSYCCPKMMGLPDMLRCGLGLEPQQMVSPVIDMKEMPSTWQRSWVVAASKMGRKNKNEVREALSLGLRHLDMSNEAAATLGFSTDRLMQNSKMYPVWVKKTESCRSTIGIMGHAYILHDILGTPILDTVKEYGQVVTAEMVRRSDALAELDTIPDGLKLWTVEAHILGAALRLIRRKQIDRLMFVQAFSCGPASIIENYIRDEAEKRNIPLLSLTVDEHSGDAGLVTRLEAFLDTVKGTRSSNSPVISVTPTKASMSSTTPIGFVNMGSLDVAIKALFRELDVPFVTPPTLSEKIVNLGKELAPEFICYPMVTLLGQMRDLADKGVERIMMIQGKGRCRLGWYAQVMELLLRNSGYKIDVLALDSPFPWKTQGPKFLEIVGKMVGSVSVPAILRALKVALAKQALADKSLDLLRELRATEMIRGQGDKVHTQFMKDLDQADNIRGLLSAYRKYALKMRKIPRDKIEPIKLGVVGEIYVTNEPYVNREIEKVLASFDTRVRVYRNLDVSSWISYHLLKTPKAVMDYRRVVNAANPYLSVSVGGHGQESVGETVLSQKEQIDGVVHLFPFTCMPEIIAQTILVKVSSDFNIPVLSLMISEQTGVAGLKTRLEAFVDVLAERRKRGVVQRA